MFFSFDYDKWYNSDLKSGGYLCVTLELFVITILLSMVKLFILLIWFHHMDTILLVLLVFLNLPIYLNLSY